MLAMYPFWLEYSQSNKSNCPTKIRAIQGAACSNLLPVDAIGYDLPSDDTPVLHLVPPLLLDTGESLGLRRPREVPLARRTLIRA